ncbi:MAG: NADH-quinone oxidoreductase subunit NuoK [Pseudomonadota bacterium]
MSLPFISGNLYSYLIIAVLLLGLGVFGMVQRRTLIGMLMSAELILNGAGLNFMAFNRFVAPDPTVGQIFALFIMGIAAAEAAIGFALVIAVYRKYRSVDSDSVGDLRG